MGFFSKKKDGGSIADVIRCDCDAQDYLIWKWSPNGESSKRENAIRFGSTLRVKEAQVAVFLYKTEGGVQDFIEGPLDSTIKTANFPILSSILGSAFGGDSMFPAEVYFLNLTGNIKISFHVDNINVGEFSDPNFIVPVSAKGSILFNISDYREFIKLNSMSNFDISMLEDKILAIVESAVESFIATVPRVTQTSVLLINQHKRFIGQEVSALLQQDLEGDFALNIKRFDFNYIKADETSDGYAALYNLTAGNKANVANAMNAAAVQTIQDNQMVNSDNYAETLRIEREETQRRSKLNTESQFIGAHQVNIQGDVAKTAAQSLGELGGSGGMGIGGDGGMNPAAMMTGMMMGGAVGGQMTGMMNSAMQGINTPQPPPPPAGAIAEFHVAINGQQSGPFTVAQLIQMATQNNITQDSLVWKAGMSNWLAITSVPELVSVFQQTPPPVPPVPPVPLVPPVPPVLPPQQ